jgi:phosphomannomutase
MAYAPSFRIDIECKADIAEEVARIYGYDKIPSTEFRGVAEAELTQEQKFLRSLENNMVALGGYGIATFSFISPKHFDKLNLPADSKLRNPITIINPLGEDTSIMRTSILPSMLEILSTNYNNRNESAKLYEIGKEYIPNPENKAAMEAIRNAVLNNKADLGLIFDTDVDRMSAVLSDGSEVNRDSIIAMIAAILAPEYPGSTIITDSVTSDRLTYFLEDVLGLKHLCYMRGYKNVINKQKELNAAGEVSPLAMETSGHGALKDNYFLDDGAFLAVKLVIALAQAAKEGKKLDSLIEKLPPLVEEGEYRFKINDDDFKSYGTKVLEEFKKRATEAGYQMPQSYEGIRLTFKGEDVQGWILLRMSLHDPVMPMNIEGARKGDLAKLKEIAKKLTDGFDKLDRSSLE